MIYRLFVPINPVATDYTFTISLYESDYHCRLRWNDRTEQWFFSLYLADGTACVESRAVVIRNHLLSGCAVEGRPPGTIYAFPLDETYEPVGRLDIDRRIGFFFEPGVFQ